MSEKKKYTELYGLTLAEEKKVEKNLKASYQDTYREIKELIQFYVNKSAEGTLSPSEMYQYNRYDALLKEMDRAIQSIDSLKGGSLNKYVLDQYELNYFGTGFIQETEYQTKLSYRVLNRDRLIKSIRNPMAQVSLKNNAAAVRQQLAQAITVSITKGEGINAAAGRVRNALGKNANNAFRIYQTETTRVSNEANLDSMKRATDAGLELEKQWIATLDERTRKSHRHLDGETRPVDKTFSNGLMMPGDPTGPPGEVINCRCTMITKVKGYDNAYDYRRARGVTGKNEKIPYQTYEEWEKNRVSK